MQRLLRPLSLAAALLLAASGARAEVLKSGDGLQPGLAVCYINAMVRHVDQIYGWLEDRDCKPGDPIKKLNYRSGKGKVLTSRWSEGVLAKITGYIHLEQAGDYVFAFESNDGVRLRIDGMLVVQDPDVHKDRFSDLGTFHVKEPGWYPLLILYFERKNTSTLRFYWQPPDSTADTMPLVPPEVLAHK